ncbi:conserved hypothetical protein [Talaromyces stipitatus ATCC 10500]|uniref:Telomere length regulation protein conserved domain-containing protein n=1 Tax=Talaromyces stipitatus (strain ATCC 10500 / CBS 375.48 / QM 6759 / NRRL 1006) TaxID=441959 RepID=B8MRR8_TALSN|nr:uncharacterized protein TSTA_057200 [Talaromyces stipitatus ATCC 10500]EED13225.1 conserved hypothetical protein [Talaromyces stipitatus ATCC 10500]
MDGLLNAVQTKRIETLSESAAGNVGKEEAPSTKKITNDTNTPEALLQLLQKQPNEQELYQILKYLDPLRDRSGDRAFDIRLPNPLQGQTLHTLLNKTIPDHWGKVEKSNFKIRGALLRCFSSVAGLRALVGYIQTSNNAALSAKERELGRILALRDVLSFTSTLLKPNDFVSRVYHDNLAIYDTDTKRRVAWTEFCSLLSGGKILSTAAEALAIIKDSKFSNNKSWIGEGHSFAEWLGRNMSYMIIHDDDDPGESAALIVGRATGLGYTDRFVHELYTGVIVDGTMSPSWGLCFQHLRHHERSAILQSILKDVQKRYFATDEKNIQTTSSIVGGVSALLHEILNGVTSPQETLRYWLSNASSNVVTTFALRRALVLLVARDAESLRELLEQAFREFGDSFSIKHTILPTQEANAQILLLAAGYLHRLQPSELYVIGRSSLYLNAVSNRLAASATRARFLGMIVGMAVSELVEPAGKAMKFDLEGFDDEEAEWYLGLTRVEDKMSSIHDLQKLEPENQRPSKPVETLRPKVVPVKHPPSSAIQRERSKIVAIEEISDEDDEDDEEEEDEFMPYAKPDSDASDSEEDTTLVQRGKPSAPVYIRDLVSYLKDSDNVDRYHLGITNAASLIRRKAGFGTELLENIDGLALVVISLQDNYSLPNFHEYRLQAMIALLAAQPIRIGRYFTATFFDGDLSQTQRSAILTAMGLGAREIAGHGEEDAKVLGLPSTSSQAEFPSKKLPSNLQQFYDAQRESSPVSALTQQLSRTSLQPLALDAADAASGPNVLKVRTFSSRMEVERQRQLREAQRKKKTVSKDLHKDLTEGFFYPLVGRFAVMLQSRSVSSSSYNPFYSANILRLFLQTVTLIISTLGPHTPALPTISQETLALIFTLHGTAVSSEPIVLPALLSLFLAVIDLNIAAGSTAEERLVTDHGVQVIELRDWCNDVFERTPATSSNADKIDDTEQTRMLAAGILVKLGEVIQRYQGRLMGINVGFKY